jgi:hypothetical protein
VSKVKKLRASAGVRNTRVKNADKRADPVVRFEVRELDPFRKCGPGTSVQWLYRVIERSPAGATNHMVFYDRHGWYCEHGRSCAAVGWARKYKRPRRS